MAQAPARMLSLPPALRRLIIAQQPSPVRAAVSQSHQISSPALSSRQIHSTATHNGSSQPPSSVNATEVSHFSALASDWWDPHGSSRLLHLMNPLRHDFIQSCTQRSPIDTSSPRLRVLDIGCGGGIFTESAARLPCVESAIGIDPTPECIAVAQRHARSDPVLLNTNGKLKYINTSIEGFVQELQGKGDEAKFDIITLFEVIEHIQQPSPFLTTALSLLKPGGWLVGSTIARTWTSWFTTKFMAEEVLRMVPRGTHEWSQYIQPDELQTWVGKRRELDSESWRCQGVVYVPGVGWRVVQGSEAYGNYFFGVRKSVEET